MPRGERSEKYLHTMSSSCIEMSGDITGDATLDEP